MFTPVQISLSAIFIGGFIAATYQVFAMRSGMPVGFYFRSNGIMTTIGGIVCFAALVLAVVLDTWWTALVILIAGWLLGQVFIYLFRRFSQPLSAVLMVTGTAWLLTLLIRKLFGDS